MGRRAAHVGLATLAGAFLLADEALAESCAEPSLRFRSVDYVARSAEGAVTLGAPVGVGVLPRFVGAGCELDEEAVTVFRIAGVEPVHAVAVAGRREAVYVATNRCTEFAGGQTVVVLECLRRPLRFAGADYLPARLGDALSRGGEEIGTAVVDGRKVTVARVKTVDPSIAVAVAGDRRTVYVAPGRCLFQLPPEFAQCLRAGFWLDFEPPAASAGDVVWVGVDGTVPGGAPAPRLFLLGRGSTSDVVSVDDRRLLPLGRLRPRFDVPQVSAGDYRVLAACPGCQRFWAGRPMRQVGAFTVEPPPPSLLTRIGLGALFFLVLAAGIVLIRRLRGVP